jgi:NAD(P)-dependent dehydrogenase (short-subunit alcohol dehydrogenase family)
LITREVDSAGFKQAFDRLATKAQQVSAAFFGQDSVSQPFTAVPRNAALLLTFSKNLGLAPNFFETRDANGRMVSVNNTIAVQLLEIRGDPYDGKQEGDFRVIPSRIVNAGIGRDGLLMWMADEAWDEVIDASLNGFFNVVRPLFAAQLMARKGRVVASRPMVIPDMMPPSGFDTVPRYGV